jgi:glucose-6-phosphate 3-dehydrogenase
MRVAIVGAGNIGRVHAEAVLASPASSLAGIYEPDAARSDAVSRALGVRPFGSLDELLEESAGVIVASPNHAHAAHACAALRRGKHVLCEKPMAVSVTEAAEMADRATTAPGVCGVGFNYRYLEVIQEIRRRIDEGDIGRVLHVSVAFHRRSALTRKRFTWRDGAGERSTSGALGDLGVHLIDLLHFLFRSPVDTGRCLVGLQTKVATKEGREVQVDDYAFVSGGLDTGTHFTLTASKVSAPGDLGLVLTVTGSRAELAYHSQDGPLLRRREGVVWEELKFLGSDRLDDPPGEVPGWADSFLAQLNDWTATAAGRPRPETLAGFDDGYLAQQVLEALLRQGREGLGLAV